MDTTEWGASVKGRWELAAIALAAVVLTVVAGAWVAQSGRSGPPPAVDFVHLYTIGYAAAHVEARDALVSDAAWWRLIGRIAPGRSEYPRVYGPHVALLFAPFSYLPLFAAYLVWNLLSLTAFFASVTWFVRRHAPVLVPRHFWTTAAVCAFPALAYALILGHASVLAVVALAIFTHGLARRSCWIAGLGVGLLAFKPTLLLPAVAVMLVAGQLGGVVVAIGVAATSLLVTIPILGVAPIQAYLSTLLSLGQAPDVVANPTLMCSLRTFWYHLLPPGAALVFYAITAGVSIVAAGWGWRRTADPLQRAALTSVAIALATPHLYYYDLVIVTPAVVASAAWVAAGQRGRSWLRATTGAAYFAPLSAPIVALAPVHVPALIIVGWFGAMLSAWCTGVRPGATGAPTAGASS